jgi:hypothetical protein
MTAPVGKTDAERDGSTTSTASSPDAEPVGTYTQENPEHPQQQKRKGGRKPVSLLPLPCPPVAQAQAQTQAPQTCPL